MTIHRSPIARSLLAALLLSLPMTVAPNAHAQGAAATNSDAAKYFQQGKDAYKDGRYPDAYAAYKRAWEIQKGYDIAGNLANVEVKLGRYRDAVEHLRFVEENLPPSITGADRDRVVRLKDKLLAEATSHLAMITIAITPDGATLTLDGKNIGVTPLSRSVPLDPGTHELVATLDGYEPLTHSLSARENTSETVRMTMVPTTGPGPTTPDDNGPSVPIIVVGSSLAVISIGVGAAFLGIASGKADDIPALQARVDDEFGGNCGGTNTLAIEACENLESAVNDESTFTGAGIGMLIGGGVIGAATLAYALWPRDDGSAEETATALPVMVTPIVAPGYSGISISGSF